MARDDRKEGSADPQALREKTLRVLVVSVVILSRMNEWR